MRITKTWVRNQRIRMDERIKMLWKCSDEEVKNFLKALFPIAVPGTREENLKNILLLSLDEFFPDAYLA